MLYVINNTESDIVMLKRIGTINSLPIKNKTTIKYNDLDLTIGNVKKPVCCYIITKDNFKLFLDKNKKVTGNNSKVKLGEFFKTITKIKNVTCNVHLNVGKYMFNNKNVWEKL